MMSTGIDARATTDSGSVDGAGESTKLPQDESQDVDDFGLPRRPPSRSRLPVKDDSDDDSVTFHDADGGTAEEPTGQDRSNADTDRGGKDVVETSVPQGEDIQQDSSVKATPDDHGLDQSQGEHVSRQNGGSQVDDMGTVLKTPPASRKNSSSHAQITPNKLEAFKADVEKDTLKDIQSFTTSPILRKDKRNSGPVVSEWSHQRLVPKDQNSDDEGEEVPWQAMPALGEFDIYDDTGRVVAKGEKQIDPSTGYTTMGGASKGYTRVQLDEDAQSATSLDDDTNYLFKQDQKRDVQHDEYADEEEDQRDAATQLQNTKDLLTEGQRIAYVGVVRLTMHKMIKALEDMERTKATRKEIGKSVENMELWSQKVMLQMYSHMDIDNAEQLMIEQLAEHGVQPSDLVPPLMQNARVKNPAAGKKSIENGRPSLGEKRTSIISNTSAELQSELKQDGEEVPEVHGVEEIPRTENLDLDLRWTVLCDLFLVLISDSTYDSRSRRLLERVASAMQITWLQICRFEKRVIDALEGQESELQEDLDETDNMEKRRKAALTRRYVTMGLATVGGGLVIGLSAGLLAPMIGAGLAAGFGVIGVSGTAGFLGGVGGAALITSIGVGTGGTIAVRASNRRMGHVKTFEYRPLHNNKRLNLILTVAGWMNGKIDDVRLPYSTVDPIMGDVYSLLWEPEMLRSMGDTINILATEALTQTVQQVLGSTLLITLMASLQLPIVLTKLAYLIDNPWSVSLDRANSAGLILADSLMQKHLGARPITLVGFSLGARLIFECLKELSNRGAYGIIQNVYLFGSPVVAKKDDYLRARSVIAGRFVSG
jgi:Protein of unknown function (DUF726)